MRKRIFLLSPANLSGRRAKLVKLGPEGSPIAEVFSFISSLYFRGKVAYSTAFAVPPEGLPGALVITASRGLSRMDQRVTPEELSEIASVPIDSREPKFRAPLERDVRELAQRAGNDCDVILLGSVATSKYVEPLLGVLGNRLLFPAEFAGRGDMSRGGLMLRCAREGVELDYVPILGGQLRGVRPPRLSNRK